jgi:Na+/H+ antiporter NhaD/arsenite permease-like protein
MSNNSDKMQLSQILIRGLLILGISTIAMVLARMIPLNDFKQVLAIFIFVLIISSTLVFWNFRLAIAFIGVAIILGGKVLTLEEFIRLAEVDIILFLIGMMTLVGVLKDLGLFSWIIQTVIELNNMTGRRFILLIIIISALLACVVDEVTSIVFMIALIFQVCDTLKVRPTPFVIISVMATNIGSSGTMLGNPVGILIGTKAGMSFIDYVIWATPIMMIALIGTMILLMIWFRNDISQLDEHLQARRKRQLGLGPLIKIPYHRGLLILGCAITLISLHHNLEEYLGIAKNTLLIVTPLAISGILMIWRNERAHHYIESEVEWWTLLFFMMLFAIAGSLETTGVTSEISKGFTAAFGKDPRILTPVIVSIAAIGSAFVDNIVFIAAFIPIVNDLGSTPLWWALLFGGCFGGNVTMIGSTANIVAIGMMEKRYRQHMNFLEWFKIGFIVGLITCSIATIMILLLMNLMPTMTGY